MITTNVSLEALIEICVAYPQTGCELLQCETVDNLWQALHSIIQRKIDSRSIKLRQVETAIANADRQGSFEDVTSLEKWGARIKSEIDLLNNWRHESKLPKPIAPKVVSIPSLSDLLRKYA